MANSWFPQWRKRQGNLDGAIVAPDERLPLGQTIVDILPALWLRQPLRGKDGASC